MRAAACHLWNMQTVYEAAGGADGLLWLASAWHARVMADEVVSHAFSHGFHPEHSQRLAAYWAEVLGGPTTYSECYGDETSVVRIHSGNGPHEEMDRRAIACFDQALVDVGLTGDDRLRQVLHDYFAWTTVTTMFRYHRSAEDVPDGLHIPGGRGTDLQRAIAQPMSRHAPVSRFASGDGPSGRSRQLSQTRRTCRWLGAAGLAHGLASVSTWANQ